MSKENLHMTKGEYVFQTLKKQILTSVLKPGSDIVISKISKKFNISIIPVREALKRLESEGLIENEPHKSAKVVKFNLEKLRQIIIVRAGLEGYLARLAVPYINEVHIKKMEKMLDKMKTAMENNKSEIFNLENLEFHRYLYQIAPYPILYNITIKVWDGGKWIRAIFALNHERMKASLQEHIVILKAVKERNEDKVEQLTREHRMKVGYYLEKVARIKGMD